MKTFKNLSLVAVLSLFGILTATAQNNVATANASATIVQDLEIEKTADMNFGLVIPSSTAASTVILAPIDGGVTLGTAFGQILNTGSTEASSAAAFTVTGTGLSIFTITLPADITITNSTSDTMTIDNLTSTALVAGVTLGTVLGELDVTSSFNVGGTLNVAQSQAAGEYNGTFDVEVNYL